ncbi:hypothetical protein LJC63_12885, partial [Ruminococcaceae bacterium OttesenSCG-928-L11]|nr:hypothetical protein [Ruminococcaceae bacterium OttesenSCG-928-L11]
DRGINSLHTKKTAKTMKNIPKMRAAKRACTLESEKSIPPKMPKKDSIVYLQDSDNLFMY